MQAWIYQITRNLIADHNRKVNREKLAYDFAIETEEMGHDHEVMDEA